MTYVLGMLDNAATTAADDSQLDGFRYEQIRSLSGDESLAPLALPEMSIVVSSLFPPNL